MENTISKDLLRAVRIEVEIALLNRKKIAVTGIFSTAYGEETLYGYCFSGERVILVVPAEQGINTESHFAEPRTQGVLVGVIGNNACQAYFYELEIRLVTEGVAYNVTKGFVDPVGLQVEVVYL